MQVFDPLLLKIIPEGFCQCGCGNKTDIAKRNRTKPMMVKGQPLKFIKRHHRKPNRIKVDEVTGCWLWQLSVDTGGYGHCYHNGEVKPAHRVAYEILVGPIPDWADALHHECSNRRCVNPEHLRPITDIEHMQIGSTAKLTWDDVNSIREEYSRGVFQKDLATRYGVTKASISSITLNKTWRVESNA